MKGGCNFPMGPLALLDLVGLDTSLAILDALYDEFRDPNYAAVPTLRRMVAAGHLGRKSSVGFYDYTEVDEPAGRTLGPVQVGSAHRRDSRPTTTASSASAPTSSRARSRRLPPRPVPDAGRSEAAPSAGGRPTRGAICRSTGCASAARCASRAPRSRSASTPRSTTVIDACADPRRRTAGSPTRSATPTSSCTGSAGRTASRRGRATASSRGGLYGVAIGGLFAGESMFHRAHRRVEGGAGRPGRAAARRRGRAARRAVDAPTPRVRSAPSTSPRPTYLERWPRRLRRARSLDLLDVTALALPWPAALTLTARRWRPCRTSRG